jgi:hypothetical protein
MDKLERPLDTKTYHLTLEVRQNSGLENSSTHIYIYIYICLCNICKCVLVDICKQRACIHKHRKTWTNIAAAVRVSRKGKVV